MALHHFSRRTFLSAAGAAAAGRLLPVVSSAASQPSSASASLDLGISELGELLRRRKISSADITRACLDRIGALNPTLNAFITVTGDRAVREAQAADDEMRRGKWRGPLHGVPIAMKDLVDTAGIPTTAGSALFKDRVPTQDAEIARRLGIAGAVLVGKTNMHEFAFGGSSLVTNFGGVRNPWDRTRIAGGSSGGSASAVAAGLCYAAIGSDTAGSIRQPAAYCGIVGLKPTFGLVSTSGVIPLSWSFDHIGPMTRTVRDAALMLQAIAGYDPNDAASAPMTVPDYSASLGARVSSLRVGVARAFFFDGLDPEIDRASSEALSVIAKLTGGIKDVEVSASTQEQLRSTIRAAEAYAYHAAFLAKSPELYQPETRVRLRTGADVTTVAYIEARRELARTRRSIGHVFDGVDVVITPTSPILPPPIAEFAGDRNGSADFVSRNIRNTSPFDVYGWPTISVPCGFSASGLPIGLQMSAAMGQDARVLQLAFAYEQATEWHRRRVKT